MALVATRRRRSTPRPPAGGGAAREHLQGAGQRRRVEAAGAVDALPEPGDDHLASVLGHDGAAGDVGHQQPGRVGTDVERGQPHVSVPAVDGRITPAEGSATDSPGRVKVDAGTRAVDGVDDLADDAADRVGAGGGLVGVEGVEALDPAGEAADAWVAGEGAMASRWAR